MNKINSTAQLREAIAQLEIEQADKGILLKEEFQLLAENLNPIRLIKNKISEVVVDSDLKNTLLNSVLGLAAGYVSKKIVTKKDDGPLKHVLANFIQVGVGTLVAQNAGSILSTGKTILNSLFKKKAD